MPETYFIINPAGGLGKVTSWWPICKKLLEKAGIPFRYALTERPLHAVELARKAVCSGFRQIIAVGGDGTLNEVLNGMASQREVPLSRLTLGLCPLGTGNDWMRTYRLPQKPELWIAMLFEAHTRLQDVGLVRFLSQESQSEKIRYFANVAGMAYDAFVVQGLLKTRQHSANTLVYLLGLLKHLWEYIPRKYRVSCSLAQGNQPIRELVMEKKLYTLNVGICRYSGGGMQLVPQAIPDDRLLALTLIEHLPKWEVLMQIPRLFRGTIDKHPKVQLHQVHALQVESAEGHPLLLETDGEFVGVCRKVAFELHPEQINILCPTSKAIQARSPR